MKKTAQHIYRMIPFKKELFSILKFFWKPSESVYRHLHFKGRLKVKINDKAFLIEHYGFQIENEIFWAGLTNGWEKISTRLWIELCKEASVIIDVGANTGVYALVAKTINPGSSIYAFEPVDRVYKKLIHNCELNHYNIKCMEAALSNYDGEAVIYDTLAEHTYSVSVNKNIASEDMATFETKIKTTKLSTFITENNIKHIDLIKIDVEMHEAEVLEGMGEYLNKFQPTMLIEILNDEIGAKVQDLIKNIDYLFFNIDGINKPKLVDNIRKSDYYNYLICKRDVADKLKLL